MIRLVTLLHKESKMPVIRLYGFGDNIAVIGDLRDFQSKFRQAAESGSIPPKLAEEVALVQVYSSARMIISRENAQYVEIYADSTTPDSDLVVLAKFVRSQTIVTHQDIDIEIIWADGKRTYFPKGKVLLNARPPKPTSES